MASGHTPHHARQLADGIGAELPMVSSVDHNPAIENPTACNAALDSFLTSH